MLQVLTPAEIFKSFRKKYLVSNFGRVYSVSQNKFLKLYQNQDGYMIFEDTKLINGKRQRNFWYVHITLVELFGDKFGKKRERKGKLVIDHIDGNKKNNNIENLELVTQKENIIRFYAKSKIDSEEIDKELFGI